MNKELKILLAIAYLFIFGVLLNYQNAWMHRETAMTTYLLLTEHHSLTDRILQCFNWQNFEGVYGGIPNSRARILSNMFETANILLRNWLFQFIPPHPSLSLTWIIALALSPYFLYKLIKNITADKNIALVTVLLYLISPGALVSLIMLFHPGKILANFFYIFCLYYASTMIKGPQESSSGPFRRNFIFLVAAIITSLFFDEYSLFIFVLVPLFFPGLFLRRQDRIFTTALYLLIPAVYYAMLIFILPKLYALTGHPGFNFFARIEINNHVPAINLWAMVVNFFLLLHDNLLAGFNAYLKDPNIPVQVTQFFSVTNHLIHDDNIILRLSLFKDKYLNPFQVIHNILFFSIFILAIISGRAKIKNANFKGSTLYFLRSLMALAGFAVFFSLLHITNNILAGCGYYGAGFSVIFAITTGLGLKFIFDETRWKKVLTMIFLVSLMINSFYNIRLLNYAWLALHYRETYWELDMWLNRYPRQEIYEKYFQRRTYPGPTAVYDLKNNFEITYAAWKNRKNPGSFRMLVANAPPELGSFLLAEIPYIK